MNNFVNQQFEIKTKDYIFNHLPIYLFMDRFGLLAPV